MPSRQPARRGAIVFLFALVTQLLWSSEPANTPIVGELLFRIRCRIDYAIHELHVPGALPAMPPCGSLAMLERKVVSDTEDPAAQVRT